MPQKPRPEWVILVLVGAVQFVNILDFMMVMPLGPDFARALGIPNAQLGLVGGAYTASAAASGLAGSFFLDRFDRRSALGVAMLGLVLGTFAGGLATDMPSLLATRLVAGAFGGPATSLALAIVADVIPEERRGKALGAVMTAFSVASVLGVPAGLRLALLGTWRTPFFAVSGMGLAVTLGAVFLLPSLTGHIGREVRPGLEALTSLIGRAQVRRSLAMTAVVMASGFLLIPNLSAYVQFNMHYPREKLDLLYIAGGAVSFVTLQVMGRLVDRFGAFRVGSTGAALFAFMVWLIFFAWTPSIPILPVFVLFMFSLNVRNVAYNTLTSKVPAPEERARFMSIQSAVQHVASALGAGLSTLLLAERPDDSLAGVGRLAILSLALTAILPFLLYRVERGLRRV